ncbi:hypothetical protein B0H16DRAFT_1641843 [Mycena metata]|uniref:Uncharacterized protein n=1 Tax=Mycena metata TaxID=1033252 RepID=A0AAD7GPE5_9AGAR|nr:hypothetical protein B0H16DRAFT_1641843 [Mycena metata]
MLELMLQRRRRRGAGRRRRDVKRRQHPAHARPQIHLLPVRRHVLPVVRIQRIRVRVRVSGIGIERKGLLDEALPLERLLPAPAPIAIALAGALLQLPVVVLLIHEEQRVRVRQAPRGEVVVCLLRNERPDEPARVSVFHVPHPQPTRNLPRPPARTHACNRVRPQVVVLLLLRIQHLRRLVHQIRARALLLLPFCLPSVLSVMSLLLLAVSLLLCRCKRNIGSEHQR